MSSDGSDIEIKTVIERKLKKQKRKLTDEEKKLTTKVMIHEALEQSKSRKGISLYAIKKHIKEKYDVDTEKINYLIKKTLKSGVEAGTYIQTKGIGASGSFRLPPKKEAKKEKIKTIENKDLEVKSKPVKSKKEEEKVNEKNKNGVKPKPVKIKMEVEKVNKKKAKVATVESSMRTKKVIVKEVEPQPGTSKMTPKKKKNMMRRKSVGSIIKPPKMKPRAHAR